MSSASFVLVIDFEPRSLAKTRAALELAGYTVRSASSGKELKELLDREMPAVVLMEPMLPGQDGFKLCQAIKRRAQIAPLTVIVASRIYRGARYRNMAKEAGADAYFERPQQDELIMSLIGRVVPRVENGTFSTTGSFESATTSRQPAIAAPLVTTQPRPQTQPSPTSASKPTSPPLSTGPRSPSVASASALSRAVTASSSAAASNQLQDLSDGDIEDALSRALGAGLTGPVTSAPRPTIAKVQFATQADVAVVEQDPFDFDFGWVAEQTSPVDLDALGLALDEIELTGAPAASKSPHTRDEDNGFALLPERERPPAAQRSPAPTSETEFSLDMLSLEAESIAAAPTSDTSLETPVAVAPEPQTQDTSSAGDDLQGIDDFFEQNFSVEKTAGADAGQNEPVSAAIPPRFEESSRGFSGEILGDPALDPEPTPDTGPPPFASGAIEVPENLRGMDRGTAELLSSLEELENSLPPVENTHSTGWNDGSEFEASMSSLSSLNSLNSLDSFTPLDNSSSGVVHERPPASAEEQSLEEMLARITSGDEPVVRSSVVDSPAMISEPAPHSTPIAASLPNVPSDEDFDIDFGFDPVPAPPKRTERAAPASGSGPTPVSAAAPMQITTAAESLAVDFIPTPPSSIDTARRAERSLESSVGRSKASVSGFPSVLWYALIGIVLGAVALYLVLTYFGGDDGSGQTETTRKRPAVESSQPQNELAAAARGSDLPGTPSRSAAPRSTESGVVPNSRRQLPNPTASQSRSSGRGPVAVQTAESTKPASTPVKDSPANPPPEPTAKKEISDTPSTPGESAAPAVHRPAPIAASGITSNDTPTSPRPIQVSATGERERPQPVLAAPQVNEPGTTFASGPGFADPARLVRMADLDEPLRVLERAQAETPAQAVQAGVRGRVFLSVLIGDDGQVKDAKIMIEPGYGMGEAAKKAVQSWRYSKPKSRGESARVWKTEVIEFGSVDDQPPAENVGTEPNSAQSP
ncbi:MAG: TonB family protein [Acidobacteriota bacterium]